MKLAYRAYEKSGREVTDVIEAPGPAEAEEKLRQRELFVADIAPVESERKAQTPAPTRRRTGGRSKSLKSLARFTRQLHVLVRAGLPLAEGLYALERQTQDAAWRQVIADVRRRLEQGISLAKAMEARPESFDQVYRNMIAAGEKSGNLAMVLERLSELVRRRLHVRRTVRGALVYPTLLVFVSIAVFIVMLLLVVPRFADLFKTLDMPLPSSTAALIHISEGLQAYWYLLIGGLVAAGIGLKLSLGTEAGKRWKDTVVLRIPYVGGLIKSFATAQIARLLGVLLKSHLPILEALELTRGAVRNIHYQELLVRAEDAVSKGRPISSSFQNAELISPSVYEATRSGEQSGQVSPLLLDVADFLDEENEITLKSMIGLLEPGILILMGVVVAFVALSIFTPLLDATSMVGGQPR